MPRSVITGPMICTACSPPHVTTDFYLVREWPKPGGIECRPHYEARMKREAAAKDADHHAADAAYQTLAKQPGKAHS